MNERISHNQIAEQQEAGHEDPTVLVKRRNSGDIQPARLTGLYDKQGRQYAAFNDTDPDSGEVKEKVKPISAVNLSDQRQEELATELAQSAGRDAEAWEPVSRPEAVSGVAEQKHDEEVYEQLQELVQNYHQRNDDRIEALAGSARSYLDSVDEVASELNRLNSQFQYQDLSEAKEAMQRFAQNQGEQLGVLQARLAAEQEEGEALAHESQQLAVGVEDARAGRELSEDGKFKLKKIREIVEEVAQEAKTLKYATEESQEILSQIVRTLDELMYSDSGMEMYAGNLRQYVERLSEPMQRRHMRLSRIHNELGYMKV